MRLFQKGSTVLLALTVVSAPSWAAITGNPCESPIGTGAGCGTPVAIQHGGALSGGIDFAGTQYDNKCAGVGSGPACTVLEPAMRFWEQDNFGARNSGNATQDDSTSGNFWLINPANDYGVVFPSNLWVAFQSNWANTGVKGCITATRDVAEVSFCDPSGKAKYAIMSVSDPNVAFFDLNMITGGGGATGNIVPLTDVPKPTGLPALGTLNTTDATKMDVSVTIAAGANKWWTENGANDAANTLVKGIEILYQNVAVAPVPTCNSGLGGWLPVHNQATPASALGPQAPGTFTVAVPQPVSPIRTYFAARVVYTDAATSCGSAQPCPDPQTQGTPASCFFEVAGPVDFTPVGAVTFASTSAKREAGTTVSITWQTTMESNTVGFTVERSGSQAGPWTPVGGFVSAMGPNHEYKVTDLAAAANQTFFYRIKETASAGPASTSSPLRVAPAADQSGARVRNLHN